MTVPKEVVIELAAKAGFGANLRNTHLVKLMLFAKYIVQYILENRDDKKIDP